MSTLLYVLALVADAAPPPPVVAVVQDMHRNAPEYPADIHYRGLAETARSISVLERALQNPRVKALKCLHAEKDPLAWLRRHIRTKGDRRAQTVTILFDGSGHSGPAWPWPFVATRDFVRTRHDTPSQVDQALIVRAVAEAFSAHQERYERALPRAYIDMYKEEAKACDAMVVALMDEIEVLSPNASKVRFKKLTDQIAVEREKAASRRKAASEVEAGLHNQPFRWKLRP